MVLGVGGVVHAHLVIAAAEAHLHDLDVAVADAAGLRPAAEEDVGAHAEADDAATGVAAGDAELAAVGRQFAAATWAGQRDPARVCVWPSGDGADQPGAAQARADTDFNAQTGQVFGYVGELAHGVERGALHQQPAANAVELAHHAVRRGERALLVRHAVIVIDKQVIDLLGLAGKEVQAERGDGVLGGCGRHHGCASGRTGRDSQRGRVDDAGVEQRKLDAVNGYAVGSRSVDQLGDLPEAVVQILRPRRVNEQAHAGAAAEFESLVEQFLEVRDIDGRVFPVQFFQHLEQVGPFDRHGLGRARPGHLLETYYVAVRCKDVALVGQHQGCGQAERAGAGGALDDQRAADLVDGLQVRREHLGVVAVAEGVVDGGDGDRLPGVPVRRREGEAAEREVGLAIGGVSLHIDLGHEPRGAAVGAARIHRVDLDDHVRDRRLRQADLIRVCRH